MQTNSIGTVRSRETSGSLSVPSVQAEEMAHQWSSHRATQEAVGGEFTRWGCACVCGVRICSYSSHTRSRLGP